MSRVLAKCLDLLLLWRLPVLGLVLLLTVGLWPISQQLEFDQSIESLYAENDPVLTDYLQSKRWFGGDEFVIVAFELPNLFTENGLALTETARTRILELAEDLSQIPGVNPDSTQELATAMKFRFSPRKVRELLEGVLLGEDGKTTAIVLRLRPLSESPVSRGETIALIRDRLDEEDTPMYVVGEPVQIHDMFRYVEDDGRELFRFSILLLGLVILILFRSLRWVALPLLVVVTTIIWTEALLVLGSFQLSMVSSMLNSLVSIIGVATVTHVTVHYREERRQRDRRDALRRSLHELLPAIFWTCVTTAVGFAALVSSSITPVRSFGLMMALATLMVLITSTLLLPGGILLGRFQAEPGSAPAERRLGRMLTHVNHWGRTRPRSVALGALLLMTVGLFGCFRLRVETDFSKNFRESSPIVQSLRFVESRLGGAGIWEVNFPAPAELDEDYLDRVRRLTDQLRNHSGSGPGKLTKVVSITDAIDIVPTIPFLMNTLQKKLSALDTLQPELISSLYNSDAGRMRIVLRAEEQQPADTKNELIATAALLVAREFPEPLEPENADGPEDAAGDAQAADDEVAEATAESADLETVSDLQDATADDVTADDAKTAAAQLDTPTTATGTYVLLAFLIDSLMSDQLTSFALAALGITITMSVAFRSLALGVGCLLPNLFPIVLVIGGMGWLGLPINIATAMIASVSMGLTVDCSIHYISGYQRARAAGQPLDDALSSTHQSVGRALVFANIALIAGFSVLTASHFIPLVYFGILVSVAMLGGLIGNLFLLPLLLRWLDRRAAHSGQSRAVTDIGGASHQ